MTRIYALSPLATIRPFMLVILPWQMLLGPSEPSKR